MLIKNMMKRGVSLLCAAAMAAASFGACAIAEEKKEQPELAPRVKTIIEADGYQGKNKG